MSKFTLEDFVAESNRIEGIHREPTDAEIAAHETFLSRRDLSVKSLGALVKVLVPDAELRDRLGLDVRVGNHIPPRGGPEIRVKLVRLLDDISSGAQRRVFDAHVEYETLHPFTDGNGRSGRAIWLWMYGSVEGAPLGFLHHWYYHSLAYAQSVRRAALGVEK